MTRRILILGGSKYQLPLILRARERGLYVITCDYLPANPGHALADEYHDVSTTDRAAVLALARRVGADAVASMSSDPAMPTVAFVADALGLPGPPLQAIVSLTEKDAFRRLIAGVGLPVPSHEVIDAGDTARVDVVAAALARGRSRRIVKPVDSCGSKGITVLAPGVDAAAALRRAFDHSRAGRCIVEDYIDGAHLHGDGFLRGGRLVHHYLGDQGFFRAAHDTVPVSTSWPSRHEPAVIAEVVRQVETIARASGYLDGPVNIEARVSPAGDVYVIEIGPRNGGDYIPLIQQHLTGFDFVERVLDAALGVGAGTPIPPARQGIGACYTLHSERDGRYAGLMVGDAVRDRLVLLEMFVSAGDTVRRHEGSNTSLGVALLQFATLEERDRTMAALPSHLAPQVD